MGNALEPIKNWKPQHEHIVAFHIMGKSNKDTAQVLGITPVRVSQVLNDPKAKAIVRATNARIRQRMETDIEEDLIDLAAASVKRLEETVNFEGFLPGTDAKKHQDNMSVAVLKGTGFLGVTNRDENEKETPPINSMLAERLVTALEGSNKAAEIEEKRQSENEIEMTEVEVVDAQ